MSLISGPPPPRLAARGSIGVGSAHARPGVTAASARRRAALRALLRLAGIVGMGMFGHICRRADPMCASWCAPRAAISAPLPSAPVSDPPTKTHPQVQAFLNTLCDETAIAQVEVKVGRGGAARKCGGHMQGFARAC